MREEGYHVPVYSTPFCQLPSLSEWFSAFGLNAGVNRCLVKMAKKLIKWFQVQSHETKEIILTPFILRFLSVDYLSV